MRYSSGRIEHHRCGDYARKQEAVDLQIHALFLRVVPILREEPLLHPLAQEIADQVTPEIGAGHLTSFMRQIMRRAAEIKLPTKTVDSLNELNAQFRALTAGKS